MWAKSDGIQRFGLWMMDRSAFVGDLQTNKKPDISVGPTLVLRFVNLLTVYESRVQIVMEYYLLLVPETKPYRACD